MYQIKQLAEDFMVDEMIDYPLHKEGKFMVYLLKKKMYTTHRAVEMIARVLKVKQGDIGYAGLKDKAAITKQYISIPSFYGLSKEYDFNEITLLLVGFRDERIFPGLLTSNKFQVVVRNMTEKPKSLSRMVNYFGEQRFSRNNVEIGRALLKRDFVKAVELLRESGKEIENAKPLHALNHMKQSELIFQIEAYQSHIWNRCVKVLIDSGLDAEKMPMVGFGIEINDDLHKIIDPIMAEEGITLRSFVFRELPQVSAEGSYRDVYIDVKDAEIGPLVDDELNLGMKKCTVSFMLQKGSYATECVRQMMTSK